MSAEPTEPVKQYGMQRIDGSICPFPSKRAAVRFNRDLAQHAFQYKKGVLVSADNGETWTRA